MAVVHRQMPWLFAVVSHRFEVAALALGGLLVLRARRPAWPAERSLAGLTAASWCCWLHPRRRRHPGCILHPRSPFVSQLATVALIVILFRDGLEVDGELLQSHWSLPLRKLVLAMPLTAVIIAAGTEPLTGRHGPSRSWWSTALADRSGTRN